MKYRTHHQIIASVLDAANGGVRLSRLLSKAGLNSYQWPELWHELVSEDLIDEEDGGYFTTPKGIAWLARYNELKEFASTRYHANLSDSMSKFWLSVTPAFPSIRE